MQQRDGSSPLILSSGWGKMVVDGLGRGKDFKLWPGGGRNWNWAEFGTGHGNGIQVEEIADLVMNSCTKVILTTGRFKRLKVPKQTIDALEKEGLEVIVTDTKKGIRLYNDFAKKGVKVGGLFHTTC